RADQIPTKRIRNTWEGNKPLRLLSKIWKVWKGQIERTRNQAGNGHAPALSVNLQREKIAVDAVVVGHGRVFGASSGSGLDGPRAIGQFDFGCRVYDPLR